MTYEYEGNVVQGLSVDGREKTIFITEINLRCAENRKMHRKPLFTFTAVEKLVKKKRNLGWNLAPFQGDAGVANWRLWPCFTRGANSCQYLLPFTFFILKKMMIFFLFLFHKHWRIGKIAQKLNVKHPCGDLSLLTQFSADAETDKVTTGWCI